MFHVKHSSPHILLINPWITDFAAYNFWAKPLGLLYLASLLRVNDFRVTLIDCLDIPSRRKEYGDGKFYKTRIDKPLPLKSIPRNYSQYGIPEEMLLKRLLFLEEKPDLIGITSGMTYWYPGIFKLIEIIKKFFHEIPIILGGIYAALCNEHAIKYSGADVVFKSGDEWDAIKLISELIRFQPPSPNSQIRTDIYPAFELYPQLEYVCTSTSRGCPFRCPYCATHFLSGKLIRKNPLEIADEIEYWVTRYGVKNIAFYDDALLINPSDSIIPLLKELMKKGVRCNFHTPNGLHIAEINEELADLLNKAGFKTIRLGFETSDEAVQIETGGKVDNKKFESAVRNLKKAGYSAKEIGVYILAGLPGQKAEEVNESINYVKSMDVRPILSEYSPIPHTQMFERAKKISQFDLENEPLYQNNSIFPCQWEGFTWADLKRLKENLNGGM